LNKVCREADAAHENSSPGGELNIPLASREKQSTEMASGQTWDGAAAADTRPVAIEDKAFLLLVVAVSLAFAWILWPFYGAVLWGTVTAIVFTPLHRRLRSALGWRPNLAAFATVAIIVVLVILPLTLIVISVLQEAYGTYERFKSGELNVGSYLAQVIGVMPAWVRDLIQRFVPTNLGSAQEGLLAGLTTGGRFVAAQAVNIGQSTFDFIVSLFVMLYLLFFLLRDGDDLLRRVRDAIPLRADQQRALLAKFTVVVRATVKGGVVVALLQGALGGLIFWFLDIRAALLWAAVMALLALLPVVGAGLIWVPVAIYLLATGAIWQGLVLVLYGALVISLVDNILRPVLIGQDTRIPDYMVLISTLGGIAVFGVHGFIIGPLIAAMFIAVWDIFSASRQSSPLRPPVGHG
jgi:predicted PurR-regulated permease PerM